MSALTKILASVAVGAGCVGPTGSSSIHDAPGHGAIPVASWEGTVVHDVYSRPNETKPRSQIRVVEFGVLCPGFDDLPFTVIGRSPLPVIERVIPVVSGVRASTSVSPEPEPTRKPIANSNYEPPPTSPYVVPKVPMGPVEFPDPPVTEPSNPGVVAKPASVTVGSNDASRGARSAMRPFQKLAENPVVSKPLVGTPVPPPLWSPVNPNNIVGSRPAPNAPPSIKSAPPVKPAIPRPVPPKRAVEAPGAMLPATTASTPARKPTIAEKAERYQRIAASLHGGSWEFSREQVQRSTLIFEGKRPRVVVSGSPNIKQIAITFDDAPVSGVTDRLLAELRRLNVKSTFFCVGEHVEEYPETLRNIYSEGHEIANHSYHHINLDLLTSTEDIFAEWQACSEAIRKVLAIDPAWCRPPGGDFNTQVIQSANQSGMGVVFWTVNTGDFVATTPDVLVAKVLQRAKAGGIVLMHSLHDTTIQALPQIVAGLRARGYQLVTVGQLVASKKYADDLPRLTRGMLGLPPKK